MKEVVKFVSAILANERQECGFSPATDLRTRFALGFDMSRKNVPKDSKDMHYHMYVGDFGLADAFKDFGRNSGSRPYMAPEQFSSSSVDPTAPLLFDIFAVGVIAFECFSDDQYPVGTVTADVWPWQRGIRQKWNRESTWRDWASMPEKSLPVTANTFPSGIAELILATLSSNPTARPSFGA